MAVCEIGAMVYLRFVAILEVVASYFSVVVASYLGKACPIIYIWLHKTSRSKGSGSLSYFEAHINYWTSHQ